jgi:predicted DNA-binding transcriptional regulator AlpA
VTLREQLEQLPAGAMLPVAWILERLDPEPAAPPAADPEPASWREKLWTAPAETRIGVRELVEATGRSRDWAYRATSPKAGDDRIPHRKLDGELVFIVGELREWIRGREDVIHVPHGKLL